MSEDLVALGHSARCRRIVRAINGVAMSAAVATLNRWLAHQYGHQEQFVVLRQARDNLRAALEK